MKKVFVSWTDVLNQTQDILRQLQNDGWQPDYVVGLTRGGLFPANLISQYLDCRMETLKVKLRDCAPGEACESNCWMAEDAAEGKNILIVDDINDEGSTLNWIQQDWQSSCPNSDFDKVWGNTVRVAVLYDNEASHSKLPISYQAVSINKEYDPHWIIFPWENWWER